MDPQTIEPDLSNNQTPNKKLKLAFGLSDLTKPQQILFLSMFVIIVILGGGLIYSLSVNERAEKNNSQQPTAVEELSGSEAKEKLAEIYYNPELSNIYQGLPIENVNGNAVTFTNKDGRSLTFTIIDQTQLEKVIYKNNIVQSIEKGNKDDLKKGVKSETLKVNPLNEIEYVSYSSFQ